jgi:hypothetical protein
MSKKTSQPTTVSPELGLKFKAKVDELVEWGLDNGIRIDAYIDVTINGLIPMISYQPLTEEQKAQYAEHKKILAEALKVEKDTIVSK